MATTASLQSTAITLNEVEAKFRQLLLDVTDSIQRNPVSSSGAESGVQLPEELVKEPLVLRFTGGWVRDKLLGIGSHDVDVAINKMTGYQFGLRLKEYLEVPGNAGRHGIDPEQAKLAKIEANPEKSKHLETVTMKILGLDIDLVNLRKETYTEDSRNPVMEFGTPEEDALRRDATINAMFYNIHTSEVEDFTSRGMDDLNAGIIRTPLEPFTTFKDDPLRVLRLIRFASRFSYSIEPHVKDAMANEDIKQALLSKITKERIYTELEKMLRGPDPRQALEYIDALGLYNTIFVNPLQEEEAFIPHIGFNWRITYDTLHDLLNDDKFHTWRDGLIQDEDNKFLAWIVAAMVPWADAPLPPPKNRKARQASPAAASVTREGLKAPNKVTDLIALCVVNRERIAAIKDDIGRDQEALGMAVRGMGATWRLQLLFALLYDIYANESEKGATLLSYARLLSDIREWGLSDVYNLKPLIDGRALSAALSTKPGPWMAPALDIVVAWQLRNPGFTDPAAAIEEVRVSDVFKNASNSSVKSPKHQKKQGELTSTLITHFLRHQLRPLFAQTSRKADITPAGRKKIGEPPTRSYNDDGPILDDERAKPWKHQSSWAINLLGWICKKLDPTIVEREWGFLLPPILTLLEDTDTTIRAQGCTLLRLLLLSTPPQLLQRTGLAPLFEENLTISLSYLPTLTPVSESTIILPPAFAAALTLIDTASPPPSPPATHTVSPTRLKSLDKLLRHSILAHYPHIHDHPPLAVIFLATIPPVLERLGVHSVRHLHALLPLLSGVLSDPLATAYPELPRAAAVALQSVVANAWPRVDGWSGEVLKGVAVCWSGCAEEEEGRRGGGEGLEKVREELRVCVDMLRAVMVREGKGERFESDVRRLVEADGRVGGLFGVE